MNGVTRHPIRGFFAGLIAGIGIALLLVVTSTLALGTIAPLIVIVVFVVLGVLWAMFGPVRGGSRAPVGAGAPAAGKGPVPE